MEELAQTLIKALTEKKMKISAAESCTGGLIAKLLTDVPGCSAVLDFCAVTYANTAKTELLGVPPALLKRLGAVSGPVACRMARGMRRRSGADVAVAVTGIAGPGGGHPGKPVGTVFIAVADARCVRVRHCRFDPGNSREEIRLAAAETALAMTLRTVLGTDGGSGSPTAC